MSKRSTGAGGGATANASSPKKKLQTQEKTSVGGKHNAGVTSGDKQEKRLIEKKATLLEKQPKGK